MAWFFWPADAAPLGSLPSSQPTPADSALSASREEPPATAAARETAQDGAWWSESLTTPDAAALAADESDSRAGVLRGRLTVRQQPWLHPAGIELRLTRSWLDSVVPVETTPGTRAPLQTEPRTTTDEQGYFSFRLVPPASEVFFLIGHRTQWQDFVKVPKLPRAGETLDLGCVWIDQRGEIQGTITLHGRPVAGVTLRAVDDPLLDGQSGFEGLQAARTAGLELFRVPGSTRDGPIPDWVVRRDRFLPFPTTMTDAEGKFVLRGVRPGNQDLFAVKSATGGEEVFGRATGILVAAGRTTVIGTLELRYGSVRILQFVDEAKQPWVGAHITMLSTVLGYGSRPIRTDAGGRVLVGIAEGDTGTLLFAPPEGSPWQQVPHDADHGTIVVPRAKEIEIALFDERGRLLPNGRVRSYVQSTSFRPEERALPSSMQPVERQPGRHVGLAPCWLLVVAAVPGFAPAVASTNRESMEITLLPLQPMTVRAHDLQGQPVADAAIRAHVHGNPELRFLGASWGLLTNSRVFVGTTNAEGELTVPCWPTFFSFEGTHRDFAPSPSPKVMATPNGRVDLLMLGGADIHGTLTIEMRPAPAGMRVRAQLRPPTGHPLESTGFRDERFAVTGDGGTFSLRQLVAGFWELSPELPRVPTATGAKRSPADFKAIVVQLDEGQELHTTLEIQQDLLEPTNIEGTVTVNGATIGNALVRVRSLDSPEVKRRNELRRQPRRAGQRERISEFEPEQQARWSRCETDVFGSFRFRDLRAGAEYELRVDMPQGGRLQYLGRRVVRAGAAARPERVDFALHAGDVRLACLRAGLPLQNRMMRLRQMLADDVEGARFELLLDANGQAWIEQLPTGTWTIEPMHGGRCEPATFEVTVGASILPDVIVLDR